MLDELLDEEEQDGGDPFADGSPGLRPLTVREAGRKGGQVTSQRHGPEFYEEIGRKGGQKVRALIEAGKRAQAESAE